MQLDDALKHVSVVGAGGKMGRGISALLLQEMARVEASKKGSVGNGDYELILIDSNKSSCHALRKYLSDQILKYAEKNITTLRTYYAPNPRLVSNEEIIQDFVDGAMSLLQFDSSLEKAADSHLIFEAIVEDVDAKVKSLKAIAKNLKGEAYFFSNTSSIPIHVLNELAQLDHKIIGFHFYNPPIVQKLIEVIIPEKTHETLKSFSSEIIKRLNKIGINAHDIAGFIGNGHFIREAIYACSKARELGEVHSTAEGVYLINYITQNFLVRPMGIFQLIDYVGIDVCSSISKIMRKYLPDEYLKDPLLDWMLLSGNLGGQNPDGTQKPGFFQYDGLSPIAAYSVEKKEYIPFKKGNWASKLNELAGPLPDPTINWKSLQNSSKINEELNSHFEKLFQDKNLGAEMAKKFLHHSYQVAEKLVQDQVADKMSDVNKVLMNGFYHLYGPDNAWVSHSDLIRSQP